jgi:hypothetical protein
MSDELHLEMDTDSDFMAEFTLADDDCGNTLTDLTVYNITAHVKVAAGDLTPAAVFTVEKPSDRRGILRLVLPRASVPAKGLYVYDIRFVDNTGKVLPRFISSTIEVSESVTKGV